MVIGSGGIWLVYGAFLCYHLIFVTFHHDFNACSIDHSMISILLQRNYIVSYQFSTKSEPFVNLHTRMQFSLRLQFSKTPARWLHTKHIPIKWKSETAQRHVRRCMVASHRSRRAEIASFFVFTKRKKREDNAIFWLPTLINTCHSCISSLGKTCLHFENLL